MTTFTLKTIKKRVTAKKGRISDSRPKKALTLLGMHTVTIKDLFKPPTATKTIKIQLWRRGIKTVKTTLRLKRATVRQKSWPKTPKGKPKKLKSRTLGKVIGAYNVGHGPRLVEWELLDRGPKSVRPRALPERYLVVERHKPTKRKGEKFRMSTSQQSRSFGTIKAANAFISARAEWVRKGTAIKPDYLVVTSRSQNLKNMRGYLSLKTARRDMDHKFNDVIDGLKEREAIVKAMRQKMRTERDSILRNTRRLPKVFTRTVSKRKVGKISVEIRNFSKRVEYEAQQLSELLTVKVVRWKSRPPGAKLARWQEIKLALIRWGQSRKVRPVYVPSYTVTDQDGRTVTFAAKPTPKMATGWVREDYETMHYSKTPLKYARAHLDGQIKDFFAMLRRAQQPDVDYRDVKRTTKKHRVGNLSIKEITYGYLKGGGWIMRSRGIAVIGGTRLEVWKRHRLSNIYEWQVRRKTTKGGGLFVKHGTTKTQVRSTAKGKTIIRRAVASKIGDIRLKMRI